MNPTHARTHPRSPLARVDNRVHVAARAGDFASLYQKPRDGDPERLFLPGLRASNVWYGHELSVCWMQTELPPGFAEQMKAAELAQSYEESGWVRTAASLWMPCAPDQPSPAVGARRFARSLADSRFACALSRVCRAQCFVEAAISAGLKVGTRRLDLGKRTERAMDCAYGGSKWNPAYTLEGVCAAARLPPLLPEW